VGRRCSAFLPTPASCTLPTSGLEDGPSGVSAGLVVEVDDGEVGRWIVSEVSYWWSRTDGVVSYVAAVLLHVRLPGTRLSDVMTVGGSSALWRDRTPQSREAQPLSYCQTS